MKTILCIGWTGRAITVEELTVLRNVAILFLKKKKRQKKEKETVQFTHEICEGSLTRLREGLFGSIGGTFFRADLAAVGGVHGVVEFLLPRGTEHIVIDEESVTFLEYSSKFPGTDFKERREKKRPDEIDPRAFVPPESRTVH